MLTAQLIYLLPLKLSFLPAGGMYAGSLVRSLSLSDCCDKTIRSLSYVELSNMTPQTEHQRLDVEWR